MALKYKCEVPDPGAIIAEMPIDKRTRAVKTTRDKEIKKVITGKSRKMLIFIGPCSADDESAVCEYVSRLAKLQDKVKGQLILIPRIYTNKPRTTGVGYKGMLHQPRPTKEPDLIRGLKAIRKMHIRAIRESGLTAADEMLYPENYPYLEDVLSYVTVGARSVENQQHRLTVSGLEVPIGMKNPTSGDMTVMLNSVQAAQEGHVFIYRGDEVETNGNPLAHCILRGGVNRYGQSVPNYHYEDIRSLVNMYENRKLANPAVIVDTNHSNSDKMFKEQPRIAMEVLDSMRRSPVLKKLVKGFMVESYLVEGAQDVSGRIRGKSITDPCLGWEDSKRLVTDIADYFSKM